MAVKPIPDGYHSVTPQLDVKGAAKLIDFMKQAFGAEEVMRMPGPGGALMHAEVKIGDSIVMMSDAVREVTGPPGAPALILLHGLGANADLNWFTCFGALGRHFRVVAFDQRGHGRGIRVGVHFRMSDAADDAVAVADALGIDRFIVVGYSMGGPVAQLLWHRHRGRVAGLVLCATSRNFRGRSGNRVGELIFPALIPGLAFGSRLVPAPLRRKLVRDFLAARIRNPAALQWVSSEVGGHDLGALLEAAGSIARFNSAEWIASVDVPTAVVVTERDQLVSPAAQRKLAQSIPGATIHSVDGDHGACAYRPREFAAALLDACESVVSRGWHRAAG